MVAASDRTPCPQCGGLIHPIAGRCKFCKADLATLRGGRPAAAAALPSLANLPAASRQAAPVAPLAYDDSQPVLPPRTTARQLAVEPERAWWKSWPLVVIILASAAIVVAVVLLVWPPHKDDGKHLDQPPPPANDRMDTSPLVPGGSPGTTTHGTGSADPWQGKNDPTAPGGKLPPPDPIPPAPADPDDDDNLGGILGGGTPSGGGGLGGIAGLGSVGMMGAMIQHGCARMSACSTDQTIKMTCSQLEKTLGHAGSVPTCAAAQRCLDKLDKLDCDMKIDDLAKILGLQSNLEDCVDAMQCS